MKIELSNDQKYALDVLTAWYKSHKAGKQTKYPFVTMGGYAGTGKTTLISIYRKELEKIQKNISVAFCAFTGKAAQVLSNKLHTSENRFKNDSIGTIHSLIYSAVTNTKGEVIGWDKKDNLPVDLIIIDEASMVDEYIWNDLLSYKIPMVAVGDHGQLPPIRGSFNLMNKLNIKLEEIHRQARQNPIINVSILARQNGEIPVDHFSAQVFKVDRTAADTNEIVNELLESYNHETLVLCGLNSTRTRLNQHIRSTKDFHFPQPDVGDRVICLRNNHKKNIYNGMLGTISSIEEVSYSNEELLSLGLDDEVDTDTFRNYYVKIGLDDEVFSYEGTIAGEQFNQSSTLKNVPRTIDLYDFGYAITVHKAQGSQAKRVILFEERFSKMSDEDWRRWLYTAVTRAEEELYIVGK